MLKTLSEPRLPGWVTEQSMRYLAHTSAGRSIRGLARDQNCHPSTILRQIRRVETRRDDPLVDEVLNSLGRLVVTMPDAKDHRAPAEQRRSDDMSLHTISGSETIEDLPSDAELNREAPRILRRLCESGAVLALAAEMEKAVVVRDGPGGSTARTAVVDRAVAQAMALNEWIACQTTGRIARYTITQAGRAALGRMMAHEESRCAAATNRATPARGEIDTDEGEGARKVKYGVAESPLCALARRKDRDGRPFLPDDLVAAGERLREDFELAQVGPSIGQSWDRLLTGGIRGVSGSGGAPIGQSAAQARVLAALHELGSGLGDVALRCCCFLEGLETAEKRLGWSARSGKIVLRIALQRLKRHYAALGGDSQMIG
ncbi:DUF6456 domain-containing protein [Aestuariivita boseongensis]|uniref:DUF6456 domain-containing protein n=1 Tax=Aestuariivita boseongensis TaxID=1470562 RepID=UPI000680B5A9|nr:DUF6456 domain-containing protein [Aestuariivita boseongensis]